MPNISLEQEIQQYNAIMALVQEGKTAPQIVKALFHGKTVYFAGVKTVAEKNAAMARYINGLGKSHPLEWKRFGIGAGVGSSFFSKDSGLKSWEDVFQLVDAFIETVGFAMLPTPGALKDLPQEWGPPPPGLLEMVAAVDGARKDGRLDEDSDRFSPTLYQRLVIERNLILDNEEYRRNLKAAARSSGIDGDFSDFYLFDDFFRSQGMGAGAAPRSTARTSGEAFTNMLVDAFEAKPLRVKALVFLELKKHLVFDEHVALLDVNSASDDSVDECVNSSRKPAYTRFMIQKAKRSRGCVGRRKRDGWEDHHYLQGIFASMLGAGTALDPYIVISILSFVVPDPRFNGQCSKLCGIGTTDSSCTTRVAALQLLDAAHAVEGTEKPTYGNGKPKQPCNCTMEELRNQDILTQCVNDHRKDTAEYNRELSEASIETNTLLESAASKSTRIRLKNQKVTNTMKVSGFGGKCVSPGCNECVVDPNSAMCQILEMQHVSGLASVVVQKRDGSRYELIEPKKAPISSITNIGTDAVFVTSNLTESVKTLPLCTSHHKCVDRLLDLTLVRSALNYHKGILLSDSRRVDGYLIFEDRIDNDITGVLDRAELLAPGYVQKILLSSAILKLAVPNNYVAPVQDGVQNANAESTAEAATAIIDQSPFVPANAPLVATASATTTTIASVGSDSIIATVSGQQVLPAEEEADITMEEAEARAQARAEAQGEDAEIAKATEAAASVASGAADTAADTAADAAMVPASGNSVVAVVADNGSIGNDILEGHVGNHGMGMNIFDYGDGDGDGEDEIGSEEQIDSNAENVPPDQWVLPTPNRTWTLGNGSTFRYRPLKKHRTCLSMRS